MQAIKRYWLVILVTVLILTVYLYRKSWEADVVGGEDESEDETGAGLQIIQDYLTHPPTSDKPDSEKKVEPTPDPTPGAYKKNLPDRSVPEETSKEEVTSSDSGVTSSDSGVTSSDSEVTSSDSGVTSSDSEVTSPAEQAPVLPLPEWEVRLERLSSETGLSRTDLDRQYNMSRVSESMDLHDLTFLDNYYNYNYKEIDDRLSERASHINKVCNEVGNSRSAQYNLYHFNEQGFTWCPVFKSGSTTWRDYFIERFVESPKTPYYLNQLKSRQLTGAKRSHYNAAYHRQYYRGEEPTNVRFSAVRHPFSRLVSHVRSSGRDQEMNAQKDMWIKSAMVASRTPSVRNYTLLKGYKGELEEYFKWLEDGKPGGIFSGSEGNPFLHPPYPLLHEMVDHIMRRRKLGGGADWDGHWMPAQEFCNLCRGDFKYIIKLEEEPLELWYLTDKLGLFRDREVFLSRANNSDNKVTQMEDVWREIDKLSEEQRQFLYRHFDVDFRMFGYSKTRS